MEGVGLGIVDDSERHVNDRYSDLRLRSYPLFMRYTMAVLDPALAALCNTV